MSRIPVDQFATMASAELQALYCSPQKHQRDREEALWEFWRRICEARSAYDFAALQEAIATGLTGIGNVLGYLAQADLLPHAELALCTQQLREMPLADAPWGLRMLRARATIQSVRDGLAPTESELE